MTVTASQGKTAMTKRAMMLLGAAALVMGGCAVGIASAKDRAAADAREAAAASGRAAKALAQHRPAIADAEAAVLLAPRNADYRLVLGQSYLAAGRFASARTAFADALSLAPGNAKAGLNLALAQIATGDWATARRTLDDNGSAIAPADRGLAQALAGDPEGAVAMLTVAARQPDATPKVRQNLALSLALAGRWPAARAVAAVDVSPADLDARMGQWATLARPRAAADQVAALIGVVPVEDVGQPVALALNAPLPAMPMLAQVAPAPVVQPAATPQAPGFAPSVVVFAPRAEVAQPLPAAARDAALAGAMIRAERAPAKVAIADHAVARGSWYVQLGAFNTSAGAHEAWNKATRRLPTLAGAMPTGATFAARNVYRLSVGGYSRGQADALCHRFRQAGGDCFVRPGAGDQMAAWLKKPVQFAARG